MLLVDPSIISPFLFSFFYCFYCFFFFLFLDVYMGGGGCRNGE